MLWAKVRLSDSLCKNDSVTISIWRGRGFVGWHLMLTVRDLGIGGYRSLRVEPANVTADLIVMAARRVHFVFGVLERRSFDLTFHRSRQRLLKKLNIRLLSDRTVDRLGSEPPIPEYKAPQNEPLDRRRARLLYQSR